jgi:two-component system cell cycle sensor histidine kinase/response regulator CckA
MILSFVLILLSALGVTAVALARARAAGSALRASEETRRQLLHPPQNVKSMGRLAGDIAHDLNDLLTAITGHIELLIAHLPPADPLTQDAQEVRRAALSGAGLTRQLLALSRSEPTVQEVIDVNAVTARTAGVLGAMLGEDIAVTLALGADIKPIRAGASHVEEIVLNLALNARDRMATGGRLTLTTTMHNRPGQEEAARPAGEGEGGREYIRLVVTDTGCAIPAALQAHVFEPFFTTEGDAESAVGLAKVDGLVREAGGHIHLDSTPGVGTTFTVDLPAISESPASFSPPVSRLTGGIARILIVEDEPRVRELMRLVLVGAGHDVVAVAGPHEALAALNRQPDINLLMIDIVMPAMNGYELATEARKIVRGARIVFMSGFACDSGRQPATDGFLPKPFTVESLMHVVQLALAGV